jgi:pyruvate-ferredoxin/flavodoxin oxidoreductase
VAVVERTDEPAAADNPLTRETKAALYAVAARGGAVPNVLSVSAGLGSRDVSAGDLAAVFDRLRAFEPDDLGYVVLGIRHPLALAPAPIDIRAPGSFSVRGHSIGGLGSITTNKLLATLIGELFGKNVQAYPRYGSEKKGLPTSYNLTVADVPIRSHGEVDRVDFVPLHDVAAFSLGEPLRGLVDGGTVFIQSSLTDPAAIWASIPAAARADIVSRRIRVTALDTGMLARSHAPRADLVLRMQGIALVGVFLRVTTFAEEAGLERAALLAAVGSRLRRFYGKRGDDVIAANMAVVAAAFDGVIDVTEALGSDQGVAPSRAVVPAGPTSITVVQR